MFHCLVLHVLCVDDRLLPQQLRNLTNTQQDVLIFSLHLTIRAMMQEYHTLALNDPIRCHEDVISLEGLAAYFNVAVYLNASDNDVPLTSDAPTRIDSDQGHPSNMVRKPRNSKPTFNSTEFPSSVSTGVVTARPTQLFESNTALVGSLRIKSVEKVSPI